MPINPDRAIRDVTGLAIRPTADGPVADLLDVLNRTEDVRLSPDGARMAVAGFSREQVFVFDISFGNGPRLTGCEIIEHPDLRYPHGLEFIGPDRIAIASREGAVQIFALAPPRAGVRTSRNEPGLTITRADRFRKLDSPGSVALRHGSLGPELLVCNNYANRVTRHVLSDDGGALRLVRNEILMARDLRVPDGVSIDPTGNYVAISVHYKHAAWIYRLADTGAERCAMLKLVDYPHGLRFSPDGRHVVVADAGQPFVNVYECGPDGAWQGEIAPAASVRVMSDETYLRGRYFVEEGGPKGVEFVPAANLVAVTCETEPLAFFPASAVLGLPSAVLSEAAAATG